MSDNGKAKAESGRVEEAAADSFPASDPPAWTATRSGSPEGKSEKKARQKGDAVGPDHCEAMALFDGDVGAKGAADELLALGFTSVEMGRPRRAGDPGGGIDRGRSGGSALAFSAAIGAVAAGFAVALSGGRSARLLATMTAGGALGYVAGLAAKGGRGHEGCVLKVRVKSAQDQQRVLAVAERHGARALHVRWRNGA